MQVDALVVGSEAKRLVSILTSPRDTSLTFPGTGRVTRTLVLPDRISLLRFHFHTIQEERLLDPLLLQSLLSVSPFKCVLVTYTQGNEESLKQAQILVNLYRDHLFLLLKTSWKRAAVPHSCCAQTMRLARRISTQSRDPTKSHCGKLEPKPEQCQHNACGALCCRGSTVYTCYPDPESMPEVLTPAAVAAGPCLLVEVEPKPSLPPLPPLLPLSLSDVAASAGAQIIPRVTPPAPRRETAAAEKLKKRATEIMEPFKSVPRRVSEQDRWSAVGLYEWLLELHQNLHPETPYISAVDAAFLFDAKRPTSSTEMEEVQ